MKGGHSPRAKRSVSHLWTCPLANFSNHILPLHLDIVLSLTPAMAPDLLISWSESAVASELLGMARGGAWEGAEQSGL